MQRVGDGDIVYAPFSTGSLLKDYMDAETDKDTARLPRDKGRQIKTNTVTENKHTKRR